MFIMEHDPHTAMTNGQIAWHIIQWVTTAAIGAWFKYEFSRHEITRIHKHKKKKHRK